jgi:GNAT superfamily N-acetyltransferase
VSVRLRAATHEDAARLREIALAAKGHWGYDQELLDRWGASGELDPEALAAKEILVAEADGRVVGWSGLSHGGAVCALDDLWVEPAWIGHGIGRTLFERARERAAELGAARLEWEAEPNAIGFYERMGGRYLRDGEPTSWGRVLQIFAIDL